MKKIGLVVDFNKKKAVRLANEVKDWLKKKKRTAYVKSFSDLTTSILEDTDFIVTFGGDGTVLRTANAVAPYNIPMVRVNFGTRGYLCNIKPSKIFQALEKILNGKYRIETKNRIRAKILKGKKDTSYSIDAFNEIVVGATSTKKTAWLKLSIVDYYTGHERERVAKVIGDGIIIATQSGSTAYCLSAGGPALLDLDTALAIVASNGHFDSGFLPPYAKSFTISCKDYRIWFEITILRGGQNLPCLGADSDDERVKLLKKGERVIITKSMWKNLFIELMGDSQ